MGDGLEACGSFAGGALVLRASCHFLYSTAVIGARKRAVNRPADKEREPLFLEVSSRTSSSPIVGRRSTTQQPRETNVCHVCCHAAVMLPVCETFLSALADAAAEDAQAPVCLFPPTGSHLPTGSKPAAPSLVALSFYEGILLFLYSTAVNGARKRAVNRPADKEREPDYNYQKDGKLMVLIIHTWHAPGLGR